MALTSATESEFADFLTKYGFTLASGEQAPLALSFAFLSTLPFCTDVEDNAAIREAQCFIAFAMTSQGGAFNPAAMREPKTLVKKGLGRGAITKEWEVNSELSGVDATSALKTLPIAYGILKPYLCVDPASSYGAFVV